MSGYKSFDLSVYILLDRDFAAGKSLIEIAAAAVRGGATMLQLRDRGSDSLRFYRDAVTMMPWARAAGVPVIIKNRVDVALAVDADGVHIGEHDLPLLVTRRLIGSGKIIGVSTGSEFAADEAQAMGADYLGVGPVYDVSAAHDAGSQRGLALVRTIASRNRIPICATGGITATNAAAVIAAVRLTPDVEAATRALRGAVEDGPGSVRP